MLTWDFGDRDLISCCDIFCDLQQMVKNKHECWFHLGFGCNSGFSEGSAIGHRLSLSSCPVINISVKHHSTESLIPQTLLTGLLLKDEFFTADSAPVRSHQLWLMGPLGPSVETGTSMVIGSP